MIDILSMWKSPKMIAYTILTALLYPALLFPFQDFSLFGHADFFRIGIAIPVAFSFLFGPAAAWGAAFGNLIYDASTTGLAPVSLFGFAANFLVGYLPYKLWETFSAEKLDLRSAKKLWLFAAVVFAACLMCGFVVAWGLEWLYEVPFLPTAFVIGLTNAFWAVTVGAMLLVLCFGYFSRRKLLYTDVLAQKPK